MNGITVAQVCLENGKNCLKVGGLILATEGAPVVDPNWVRNGATWNVASLSSAAREINEHIYDNRAEVLN